MLRVLSESLTPHARRDATPLGTGASCSRSVLQGEDITIWRQGRENIIEGWETRGTADKKIPHEGLALEESECCHTSDGRGLPQNGKATGWQTIKSTIAKNSTDTIQNVFQMVYEP